MKSKSIGHGKKEIQRNGKEAPICVHQLKFWIWSKKYTTTFYVCCIQTITFAISPDLNYSLCTLFLSSSFHIHNQFSVQCTLCTMHALKMNIHSLPNLFVPAWFFNLGKLKKKMWVEIENETTTDPKLKTNHSWWWRRFCLKVTNWKIKRKIMVTSIEHCTE